MLFQGWPVRHFGRPKFERLTCTSALSIRRTTLAAVAFEPKTQAGKEELWRVTDITIIDVETRLLPEI